MTWTKKAICTLLAIAALAAVTAWFLSIFKDNLYREAPPVSAAGETVYYAAYETEEPTTQPQTEPAETVEQTVPQETITEDTFPEETVPVETLPRKVYDTVPVFFETDYPDIRFGSSTFAENGSGLTSLAMVATYLTGYEYRPDTLADYFSNYIGNQIQLLEYASDQLQLPWEKAANFHVALQALRDGKVVIAMMGSKSIFTTGQHFIVLTGLNEAGKILVNDPNEANYSAWNLKNAFADGFSEGDILCGYSGAWIYDPAAVPEEPFLYIVEPEVVEYRYPGIELTQEETDLLAKVIWAEAQGEPFEGQQAIAEVVLNRLAAGNFQSSVKSILYADGQFKSVNNLYAAKPTHIQYEAIDRALNGPYVLPIDVVFFATYAVNGNVWGKIGSHTFCYQW